MTKDSWQAMFEEPEIKLSWSPKAHHIADHFSDYFDDGGQALGVTTDQVIEHMGQKLQDGKKVLEMSQLHPHSNF